ncbi:MAG: FAD:protein FMN transferase [Clostridiales bacterium]|nr:FAD:protein FMN transferase [Clostridiales bacterium]
MRRFRCRFLPLACLVLLVPVLFGCAGRGTVRDASFFAMDTVITVRAALTDPAEASRIFGVCEDAVREAEAALSAHGDSPLFRFNGGEIDALELDGLIGDCVRTSLAVMDATEDAFDCTLGPLARLWNVTGGGPKPTDDAIREALTHTGRACFDFSPDRVTRLDSEAALDFGGIGKGAAADLLDERLGDDPALAWAVCSLGGNIALIGTKPDGEEFRVGVRDPMDPAGQIGVLTLAGGFVSVSGSYERYFEEDGVRYHHIFDGRTGCPAESGLVSVAVIAENGTLADALSTALFVMGEEGAADLYAAGEFAFEALLVSEDGHVVLTPGLAGRFEPRADVNVTSISIPD